MIIDLKGKVGLVVGIANEKSMAFGCASKFKESGAELVLTYLDDKELPFMQPAVDALQPKLVLPCDVQQDEEVIKLFEAIRKQYGKLDFMLHSIAFAPKIDLQGRVVDCSREGFLKAMDISCYSFIRFAKLVEPLMQNGGSVLTLSYYGGEKVIKHYNLMGIVKAALESATRYLACDLGESNIRVNALSPGPVMTRAAGGITKFADLLQDAQTRSPLHRLITTDDVGNMAAFLASDASKNITGTVHFVDAGYSIIG